MDPLIVQGSTLDARVDFEDNWIEDNWKTLEHEICTLGVTP